MSATAELRIPARDEFAAALERGTHIYEAADNPTLLAEAFGGDCLALWQLVKGIARDVRNDVLAGELSPEMFIQVVGTDALLLGIAVGRELYA